MEEIKFKSLNDLYVRLYPAFSLKKEELLNEGIKVSEIDLWNYLKECIWSKYENLTLHDMVNDILNLETSKLISFLNTINR